MTITKFEDIEGWQLARELTQMAYNQAARTRAAIHGFIRYLQKHPSRTLNLEP